MERTLKGLSMRQIAEIVSGWSCFRADNLSIYEVDSYRFWTALCDPLKPYVGPGQRIGREAMVGLADVIKTLDPKRLAEELAIDQSHLDVNGLISNMGAVYELLEKHYPDNDGFGETYLRDAIDVTLDRQFELDKWLAEIEQIVPRPDVDRQPLTLTLTDADRQRPIQPNEPMRICLESTSRRPEWLSLYVFQKAPRGWRPVYPNRFDHQAGVLIPGMPFWIPDLVAQYELIAPSTAPVLKVLATTESVSVPVAVPTGARLKQVGRATREMRAGQAHAFKELVDVWKTFPGRCTVTQIG